MLTPDIVRHIDDARRRGATYDATVESIHKGGVPRPHAEQLVREYADVRDHLGRPRSQANPGDPSDPIND